MREFTKSSIEKVIVESMNTYYNDQTVDSKQMYVYMTAFINPKFGFNILNIDEGELNKKISQMKSSH